MARAFDTQLKTVWSWVNRFSAWLLLLAIVWLCWSIARLLWLILAPPQAPMLPVADMQTASGAPVDYTSAFMVFEQPQPETPEPTPPPNVALKGVMVATPAKYSAALLDIDGKVQNYRVGEQLENSEYKLVTVDWNEVILADPSDQQVVITMLEPMTLDQGRITADTPSGQVSNQRLPSGGLDDEMAMIEPDFVEPPMAEQEDNINEAQAALDEAINELRQNPASYLSRMGVMATGEGYQVTQAMPDQIKGRLGLEPGDKVLAVNGRPVGSNPSQDAGLLQEIQQTGEAQIEVQRGEQVITIRQQF